MVPAVLTSMLAAQAALKDAVLCALRAKIHATGHFSAKTEFVNNSLCITRQALQQRPGQNLRMSSCNRDEQGPLGQVVMKDVLEPLLSRIAFLGLASRESSRFVARARRPTLLRLTLSSRRLNLLQRPEAHFRFSVTTGGKTVNL